MLGSAFAARRSDAWVLDQLIYKWSHSCYVIAKVWSAVVTHNNAPLAFHDVKGVKVLTSQLSVGMEATRRATNEKEASTTMDESGDVEMTDAGIHNSKPRSIHSSQ